MTTRPVSPSSRQYTASPALHVSDYLRVIYKRRWTALLGLLVVFVAGAFKSLRTTPVYEASAQLQIEEGARTSGTVTSVVEATQESSYEDDFYQTQYRILQSRALAWQAITELKLNVPVGSRAPESAPEPSWMDQSLAWAGGLVGMAEAMPPPPADETTAQSELIDGFLGGLSIDPVRNTRLVEVTYRSADPVFAARASNAIATNYRAQNLQSRFLASVETNDWLEGQLKDQRKLVQESEDKLQKYKESHDAAAVGDRQNIVVQQLGNLTAEYTRAKTERIGKEALYQSLANLQASSGDLDSLPMLASNEFLQKLKSERNTLQNQRREKIAVFRPESQPIADLDRQIAATTATLQKEVDKAVEAVRTEYLVAKAKEDSLSQALDQQKRDQLGLGRKEVEFAALEREAAGNRQLYDNLLQMAKETGVTKQFKGSNIKIIDQAEVPREPVLPRRGRDMTMALLGGCLLALGLVFGFEYMDSRIKTPDEIKAYLGLPFLGLVPTVKTDGAVLLDGTVPPAFTEAIRAIRTSVIFSSADEGPRTIVVTSTAPGEGKTSVATNLACALAQAELRTLILDGDMRRPRVHEVFGRAQEPGLSNVLVGTARLRDAIRVSSTPNLSVLPAGHLPPNPAELLGSNKYIELMDELQHQFDWIVIDAPPVMAVTDAAVIANTATGVLFVIGAESTPRRNAIAAVEQLASVRAKFVGAVLNRVNIEKHSYYYSPYYRKDYSRAYERSAR